MENFFRKKSVKRKKKSVIVSDVSESDEQEEILQNRVEKDPIVSDEESTRCDIRNYKKKAPSVMRFPFIEWKLRRDWQKKHREWILTRYYSSFKRSSLAINTSFQLPSTERNAMARIVNTRTSDMEFSPSSDYLAVASNCIKGGYISVVKTADFDTQDSLLYSFFNTERTQSTQAYFKEPILSCHWINSSEILLVRRSCRELSVFDSNAIQSRRLASLPSFLDQVLPTHLNGCFVVSLGDGQIKMIDCRESQRFSSSWTTDFSRKKSVKRIMLDPEKPNELLVAFQSASSSSSSSLLSMEVIDIRNTRFSSITGKQSPSFLSSCTLPSPIHASPISMQPFFSANDVLSTLSDGSIAVFDRYSGSVRLFSDELCSEPEYTWDGIISRPFRPCFLSDLLWVPSIVRRTQSIPIFDFQSLSGIEERGAPRLLRGPCAEDVYGCAFSGEVWNKIVVSSQGNTVEHRLLIYV